MISERKLWEEISTYRILMRDQRVNNNFLSLKNVSKCLNLFGNITEHLGLFKEIMSEIKFDLIESIFSHKLTADEEIEGLFIERLPYFMLYMKSEDKQKMLSNDCNTMVGMLNEQIMKMESDLRNANEAIEEKDLKCKDLNREINESQTILQETKLTHERFKEECEKFKEDFQDIINELEQENERLKKELSKCKSKIKDLQSYKKSHDHIDQTFMEACQDFKEYSKDVKCDPFNKKNNLETEIKAIVVMQDDLITLENHLLDDFDRRLENFKKVMVDNNIVEDQCSIIPDINEIEKDSKVAKAILEFNKEKRHFKNECMQIEFESLTLENHQIVLLNDLTFIHQTELDLSLMSSDDHKEIQESFIIDERLMSKYSAIIYISSDGGGTYYETKETIYCESCGGKVVFCPHNIIGNKVIKLPTGSTHIKIQRPEIKINSTFSKYMVPRSNYLKEEKLDNTKSNEDRKTVSSRKSQRSSITSNDSETALPFEVLIEDYENRTKITRISPRTFDQTKILTIFEDFWATIIIEDEFDVKLSEITTIYDKVYIFFLDRYANERAAMLSLYDFLHSIIDEAVHSQLMQLFCHIMLVNIDSSAMRYLFNLLDCVNLIVWSGENDLRTFLETVYPFLNEDEIDSSVLSYISYSENVYNKIKVFDFILYNILKQRDPRFIMIKAEALEFKTMIAGYYNLKEFQILLESLTSLPNKKLSIRLFKELALLYADEGEKEIAPLSKIIHIISFLSFLETVDNTKKILREKYHSINSKGSESIRWGYTRLKAISIQLQREQG